MSNKTYATIGAISLAFLLGLAILAPMPALAHNQTIANCEEGQILVPAHGNSGHQHCADPEPEAPEEEEEENGNDEQGGSNNEGESTTYVLQVNSTNLQGDPITGYFTVIELDGEEVYQGFTPVEFVGNDGATYAVTVHDFDEATFHHWDDDSTERTRIVTLNTDAMITAYYTFPSNPEEDEEDESDNGGYDDSGDNGNEHHPPIAQGVGLNLSLLYKQLDAIWALNGEIPDGQMTASEHYANGFIVYGGYWWAIILMPADGTTPAFNTLTDAQQGYIFELLVGTGI